MKELKERATYEMHEYRCDVGDEHHEEVEDVPADELLPEPCAGLAHLCVALELARTIECERKDDDVCEELGDEVEDEETRSVK